VLPLWLGSGCHTRKIGLSSCQSAPILESHEVTYLGGGNGTVLVDDISQKECLCVPLLDQLVGLDRQRSDLLVHLCLLGDKLIGISLVLLDLPNLLD
jgi:hypothetical protein